MQLSAPKNPNTALPHYYVLHLIHAVPVLFLNIKINYKFLKQRLKKTYTNYTRGQKKLNIFRPGEVYLITHEARPFLLIKYQYFRMTF